VFDCSRVGNGDNRFTVPPMNRRSPGIWPLFAALAFLMVGNGLQSSLVGIRAHIEGFPTATTGIVMSGYYMGFLVGAIFVPRIVGSVGHVRVYSGLASLCSMALLVYTLFVSPPLWFGMRVVTGFCLAGLYMVAESWLNGTVSNADRGRTFSMYMVVVSSGLAVGQLVLNVADPRSFELFVIASVLVSMAVVPIALAPSNAPVIEPPERRLPFRDIYRLVPLGVTGVFLTGISGGAMFGMGPVWAAQSGMSVGRISLFMGVALIGGVALQWPLGALSDRVSRRRVLLGASAAAAVAAAVLWMIDPGGALALVAAFAFGGFSFPMYSLSVSHANDAVPSDRLVVASGVLMFANGLGAIAGPTAASASMGFGGTRAFWMFLVVLHGGFALFSSYRLVRNRSMDVEKGRFLSLPIRSSHVTWQVQTDTEEDGLPDA